MEKKEEEEKKNGNNEEKKEGENPVDDSAMGRLCQILKYHLICLQTRIDISRRNYLFKAWDDLTLEEIMRNKLLNVHFDLRGKKDKYHLNFEEYLREVFAFIMKGVMSIDVVEERQYLRLDKIFGIDIGKMINQSNMKSRMVQASTETRNIKSQTGMELIKYHFEQKMMKKSKNQLMLDKSMETEF
mmetsp:Transcript_17982/g.27783  ORF Transcript_17982/g.27783 Transcript_17982/m.27783 type:complete len:186 (+) Transcript_17982:168-725(+)